MKKEDPVIRFWRHTLIVPFHACWEWISAKDGGGYGMLRTGRGNSGKTKAHRFSYELHYGEFNRSLDICHTCDNPGCVRPEHLFAGTTSDNMRDMYKKGRANPPRGEMQHRAKITDDDVRKIRDLKKTGLSNMQISKQFPINDRMVGSILRGESWGHVK